MSDCPNCGADMKHSPCCGRVAAYGDMKESLRLEVLENDRLRARVEELERENKNWKEYMAEELALTMKLVDALGVLDEVKSGTAVMDAMLNKIRCLTADAKVLAKEVSIYHQRDDVSQSGVNMLEKNQISDELVETARRLWIDSMKLRGTKENIAALTRHAEKGGE